MTDTAVRYQTCRKGSSTSYTLLLLLAVPLALPSHWLYAWQTHRLQKYQTHAFDERLSQLSLLFLTQLYVCVQAVMAVADAVRAHKVSTLVVDPVLVATSGDSLAGSEVAHALKTHLFPLATIITPNLPEASALLGNRPVSDLATMKQASHVFLVLLSVTYLSFATCHPLQLT